MVKSIFAAFSAGLIPALHFSSWGGTSSSPLPKPWGSAGIPLLSPRGMWQQEKMLLGKILNKMVQRMCGGEAPELCFKPRQVGGLQALPPKGAIPGWGGLGCVRRSGIASGKILFSWHLLSFS